MRYFVLAMFFMLPSWVALASSSVIADCENLRDPRSCLACNIYHEARGESLVGQVAVAVVTYNRVLDERYPEHFCAVVWQKTWVPDRDENGDKLDTGKWVAQFSWTVDGKSDRVYDDHSWQWALNIADTILANHRAGYALKLKGLPIDRRVLWYHATSVKPWWSAKKKLAVCTGNHCFYSDPKI